MIRIEVTAQSVRATLHATPLGPLLAATSMLILVAGVVSRLGANASDLVSVAAAGALAGGVALGLDDEADSMLRSSPTCALSRLGQRLIVLVPALLAAAAALGVTDQLLFHGPSARPSAVAFAALAAVGVAVQVWWRRRWPDTAAEGAAIVVMAWALAGIPGPDALFLHYVADVWHTHAPWVLGLSIVLVITGATGRRA